MSLPLPIAVSPEPINVWIVEDNRLLRQNLAELIREQNDMTCGLAVESCEEFLVALEGDSVPDVVLMDLGLPGLPGTEGLARLHSISPATKAIVLTIHAEDENVFEALCAGASGYLLKPSSAEGVVEAIRQLERGAAPINAFIAKKVLAMFPRIARSRTPDEEYGITVRERQVLQLLVDGLTMKQIAAELNLSYHTVGNHLRNIYHKLHVRSRSGAVAKALREDLL